MKLIHLFLMLVILSIQAYSFDLTNDLSIVKLSLDNCINLALKNNLLLNKEKLVFKDKELDRYTVFNKFYPDFTMSSTFNIKEELSNINLGLTSSLSLNAKMVFEIINTDIDYKIGKINYEQAKDILIKTIKKMYFTIILDKKALEIKKRVLENTKNRFRKAGIQFGEGEISELDLLNEELTYKTLMPEITKLENELNNNLNQFAFLLGIDYNTTAIELTDTIPKPETIPYPKESTIDLENNHDIKILNIKVEKEKNSKNITISSLTPTIRLSYSLGTASLKDFIKNNWSYNIGDDWKNSQSFSFVISLPLQNAFPFSESQVELIKHDSSIKRSQIELENEQRKKRMEFLNLILNLKQIEESFNILDFNLKLAEKILKLTENSFNEGEKDYLDVKEAEKSLLDANLKLDQAFYDYYNNFIELQYLINNNNKYTENLLKVQ